MFTFIRRLSDFGYGISFRFEPLKCLNFVKSPLSIASSTYFLLEAGIFPKLAFIEFLFSRVSTLTNFNSRVVLVYYRRVFEPNFQIPFAAVRSIVQLTMACDGCTVKASHYYHLSEEAI
ncbi:Hypothetical predicted protein [Prunus dulcis]|uniref:Uncharacterized protein n=1 Tax=Prunus dulcis TaxID=3755 RepID=A0A5E4FQQ3_PRUDU|nr:hypothetical protein L3X38_000307 [Prunus dulcis]VVA29806.1 Hypothetical predicted protein [Prunus dulcis]